MGIEQGEVMSAKLPVILLAATLTGIGWTAHAQPGTASAAGVDQRTERREVRPGCSVMVSPGNQTQLRYDGGSCASGLLEGIVNTVGGDRIGLMQFRAGKELRQLHWKTPTEGSYLVLSTIAFDENGKMIGGAPCRGKTGDERANSHPQCMEALRIFGENAFNGVAVPGNQPIADAGSISDANASASPRDDPKVLGGSFRP
jgi:hypothetical protein